MATADKAIGKPLDRVDGRLKVTGGARYAAEFPVEDVAYGVLVLSTVAKGQVTKIDTAAAAPDDIYPEADGPSLGKDSVVLDSHTLRCYVAE